MAATTTAAGADRPDPPTGKRKDTAMPFLNNQQRKKLAGLREAAAGETRTANGYEARAEQLDLEGRHDMAKEARKAAASHRRARQNTDQEIAGRQADPGKWRW